MEASTSEQAVQAAIQHLQAGQTQQAESICRQVLAVMPQHGVALQVLGCIAGQTGRPDEALSLLRRAVVSMPNDAQVHLDLGVALHAGGQIREAVDALRMAVHLCPDSARAHLLLGEALHKANRTDEAITAGRETVRRWPDMAAAHTNLGAIYFANGRYEEAQACTRQALALDPTVPKLHADLALTLARLGRFDEADAYNRQALALDPNWADAHQNLAETLLLKGEFREGWTKYEWRWRCPLLRNLQRPFSAPQWDGSPAPGQTILLHAEQGTGDAIQFVRYVPLVRARSGARRVVLECPPALLSLLAQSGGWKADVVAKTSGQGTSLPHFDQHLPLLGLPLTLGLFDPMDPVVPTVPYLRVPPQKQRAWAWRMQPGPSWRVGLVWAGSPMHPRDRERSIAPEFLGVLARVRRVDFYSLQLPRPDSRVRAALGALNLIDHTAHMTDFSETAALVDALDLVITVDTAVAHLAGALGKRVWVLLTYVPDWRWGLESTATPWYPTMRLFRQRERSEWSAVLEEVARALEVSVQSPVGRHADGNAAV